jgi:hypothetical protein
MLVQSCIKTFFSHKCYHCEQRKQLSNKKRINQHYFNKYIVYQYSHLERYYDNVSGQFSMIASEYIPEGTLLIVEEAILGRRKNIETLLAKDKELTEQLYPREGTIQDKVNHNCWQWAEKSDEEYIKRSFPICISYEISKFNHSCVPNSFAVRMILENKDEDYVLRYTDCMGVYTVENIEKGAEITLSYGWDIGHTKCKTWNWTCNCNNDLHKIKQIFNNNSHKVQNFFNEDKKFIESIEKEKYENFNNTLNIWYEKENKYDYYDYEYNLD